MRNATLLPLALFLASATSLAQTVVEKAARDEVTQMASEDPAMRAAFSKAAASLDEFLSKARTPPTGTGGYGLKVAVSDGKSTEYFWVINFRVDGDQFEGTLSNEPRLVVGHKLGERLTFRRQQIADWTYTDRANRRTHGNFTACALLTKEPPEQALEFKRQYGLRCE